MYSGTTVGAAGVSSRLMSEAASNDHLKELVTPDVPKEVKGYLALWHSVLESIESYLEEPCDLALLERDECAMVQAVADFRKNVSFCQSENLYTVLSTCGHILNALDANTCDDSSKRAEARIAKFHCAIVTHPLYPTLPAILKDRTQYLLRMHYPSMVPASEPVSTLRFTF